MTAALYQVDAFADRLFAGNPAAVCVLDEAASASWMQRFAAEMNLSETAFLVREQDIWLLRWFTPLKEVDLCGHATLASAHVLWESGRLPPGEPAWFETRSGTLKAIRRDVRIEMDFPALPVRAEDAPPGMLEALGVAAQAARFVGTSRFDRLVEVESEEVVRDLQVDFARLAQVDARGVIVTARGAEYDFVSRCFYPAFGIDEDPVTGSAHCALAPYWGKRLSKQELRAFQASPRGGVVTVRTVGDRVTLGGCAVTVFRGQVATGIDPNADA